MKRLMGVRVGLAISLILSVVIFTHSIRFGIYTQNLKADVYERMVENAKCILNNAETINEHVIVTRELTNLVSSLHREIDLSVLDSCGIVTDGYGYGSCVAIRPNLVITAGHCIGRSGVWVEIGGVKYEVLEQWASDKYDVGFIRIKGEVPYVKFGPMPKLLQEVYLIGAPYSSDFINSITKGIISHLDRNRYSSIELIQTDAEGAPGSSGCPLFCVNGGLLGICVSGPVAGGGVTFCEPISHIIDALKAYDKEYSYSSAQISQYPGDLR